MEVIAATAFVVGAENNEVVEGVIKLPAYTVESERELPPPERWRYAEVPGFVVLSSASDAETRRLVQELQEFRRAIGVVWPVVLRHSSSPTRLVLCGRGGSFDRFQPSGRDAAAGNRASLFLADNERAAIVLDVESSVLSFLTQEAVLAATAGEAVVAVPAGTRGAGGSDADEADAASGGDAGGFVVNHSQQLKREYTHFLLSRLRPRPPVWLEEGLAQIFMTMTYTRDTIVFAEIGDANRVSDDERAGWREDRDFNAALDRRGLLSFDEFFGVTHESAVARNPLGSTWAKQAQGFVHLWLYGEKGRHRAGFLRLLERSAHEPVSEAMFHECFGMRYRDMTVVLRGYIQNPRHVAQRFRAVGEPLDDVPPVPLRAASESEAGRVLSEVLQIGGHAEAARQALLVPYLRGAREPELIAALGMAESRSGRTERARELLEAATQAQATDPHVWVELARLRLHEMPATAGGGPAPLSRAQLASVLTPLFAARDLPPLVPELYEVIAQAWSRSAQAPRREHLAVLDEGVQRFPRRPELVLAVAEAYARHGFAAEAAALAEHGATIASEATLRERFERLHESAAPAVPAP